MERAVEITFMYEADEEPSTFISFTDDADEMDIYKFHDYCKRAAVAMGYSETSVYKAFGEDLC